MGVATERLFLPLMRLMLPEIVDVHMPAEGVFHNLVLVLHQEGISRPRAEDGEWDVGTGTDVAGTRHRRFRRRR